MKHKVIFFSSAINKNQLILGQAPSLQSRRDDADMRRRPFSIKPAFGAPNRKGTCLKLYEKDMQGKNKHVGRGFSPDALRKQGN